MCYFTKHCLHKIVLGGNGLFVMVALILIIRGARKQRFHTRVDLPDSETAYVFFGIALLAVTAVGFASALVAPQRLLRIFGVLVLLMCTAMFVYGSLLTRNIVEKLDDNTVYDMLNELYNRSKSGDDEAVDTINYIHLSQCCGLKGPYDHSVLLPNETSLILPTCCKIVPKTGCTSEVAYQESCVKRMGVILLKAQRNRYSVYYALSILLFTDSLVVFWLWRMYVVKTYV